MSNISSLPSILRYYSSLDYLESTGVMSGYGLHNGITTTNWTTANKAIYAPISIPHIFTFDRFNWFNGNQVSGNVDVGLYAADGTKIISAGSTPQSGLSQKQQVTVTSTTLTPGLYMLGFAADNTSSRVFQASAAFWTAIDLMYLGFAVQATAFPLPSPATFANPDVVEFPYVGITPTGL